MRIDSLTMIGPGSRRTVGVSRTATVFSRSKDVSRFRIPNLRIAFDTQSIRQICEQEETAVNLLGADLARKLTNRLADLSAARTVRELIAGRPRPLDGTDEYAVDIGDNYRLIFAANHVKNPAFSSCAIDWSKVRQIKILRIEGVHA